MYVIEKGTVRVTVRVIAYVDPTDQTLAETIAESGGSFSIVDVVRGEIESNLESISYVRHVSVE